MSKKKVTVCISLFVGLILAMIISLGGFMKTCSDIRSDVLRLHVLANSDSDEDQQLKLSVRDAVLEEGEDIFNGSMTVENAEKKIDDNRDRLVKAAENVISNSGFDYAVNIDVTEEYFSTRTYGDVTLPAGKYTAVKVNIGESAGHNWWCVMFPPLCLPAAEEKIDIDVYLNEDEAKVVKSSPEYEVRFKIVEWYESLKNKISS